MELDPLHEAEAHRACKTKYSGSVFLNSQCLLPEEQQKFNEKSGVFHSQCSQSCVRQQRLGSEQQMVAELQKVTKVIKRTSIPVGYGDKLNKTEYEPQDVAFTTSCPLFWTLYLLS